MTEGGACGLLDLMAAADNQGLSEDTKTNIIVLLLIFVFPIGIILMWVWMKWPTWVKIILTLIGIIPLLAIIGAVAAVVLVSVINPLEMTHRARDTVKLKDLVVLQEAINNAAKNNSSGNIFCNGQSGLCAGDSTDQDPNVKKTDGTGWVKIKLDSLASLPIDPINDSNYSYTYCSDGKDWEIQARVGSKQVLEKAANDGGDDPDQYEVGSNLSLCQVFIDNNPDYFR